LTSVIEAPTIEQLAQRVTGAQSGNSLVMIRKGGNKPPLFLVHDGDGETMLYRNLALRLEAGHGVYGLQPRSQPDAPMVHTRIPEMAAYHIGKIRSIQPHGPYLLGGMCAGGVIAFEIARQLQDQGEKVSMVALLDSADPAATLKSWHTAQQRMRRFRGVFDSGEAKRFDHRVASALRKAVRKVRNLLAYLAGEWFRRSRDDLRMKLFRAYMDRSRKLPRVLRHVPVRTVYLFAEKDHRPERRFDGEVVLFRATRGDGPDEPYIERYDDPLLGWGCRATGGVRFFDIPGGHSSMLQEPQVGALAGKMQSYIDEVLAAEPVGTGPIVAVNGRLAS
jgi:thioesterase domain-containing protein